MRPVARPHCGVRCGAVGLWNGSTSDTTPCSYSAPSTSRAAAETQAGRLTIRASLRHSCTGRHGLRCQSGVRFVSTSYRVTGRSSDGPRMALPTAERGHGGVRPDDAITLLTYVICSAPIVFATLPLNMNNACPLQRDGLWGGDTLRRHSPRLDRNPTGFGVSQPLVRHVGADMCCSCSVGE